MHQPIYGRSIKESGTPVVQSSHGFQRYFVDTQNINDRMQLLKVMLTGGKYERDWNNRCADTVEKRLARHYQKALTEIKGDIIYLAAHDVELTQELNTLAMRSRISRLEKLYGGYSNAVRLVRREMNFVHNHAHALPFDVCALYRWSKSDGYKSCEGRQGYGSNSRVDEVRRL